MRNTISVSPDYFLRQFQNAADSFGRALDLAQNNDSVIDGSNWRYVSLRRNGQTAEAARVLARITPDVKNIEPQSVLLSPVAPLLSRQTI